MKHATFFLRLVLVTLLSVCSGGVPTEGVVVGRGHRDQWVQIAGKTSIYHPEQWWLVVQIGDREVDVPVAVERFRSATDKSAVALLCTTGCGLSCSER